MSYLTPALLLDLDAFQANLELMARELRAAGKNLRPHAKAHKCVEIAKRQIAAGASGICVATDKEAELMSNAGIAGLLLTSPIADPCKIERIVRTGAMVVVDHPQQARWYREAAQAAGRVVDVLVDLDVGDHRTGAASPQQALEIAQYVDGASHLKMRGVQAYSVNASHAGDADKKTRERVSKQAFEIAAQAVEAIQRASIPVEIVSGGSTGTWDIDTGLELLTEIQAGSYPLMDLAYRKLGLPFRNALTIATTVVSANHDSFVTVAGGYKAFATDRGYGPEAVDLPGSVYRWGGDEFGYLDIENCSHKPTLGQRIEFIPPHCDPTVNLYREIHACRLGRIEAVWKVMA